MTKALEFLIGEATTQAEKGNGCKLLSYLHELPFMEQYSFLLGIQQQNAQNRIGHSYLPQLQLYGDTHRMGLKLFNTDNSAPTILYERSSEESSTRRGDVREISTTTTEICLDKHPLGL